MTSVSIIGTGNMARGIATRAAAAGSEVQVLGRDTDRTTALATELGATAGTVGDALTGDIVVLAVPYAAAAPIVESYGDALVGKVVVDITNPVDFATFAGLVTPADSSGAQEIAKSAPAGTHVVKAFNTIFASTLADGQVKGEPLDVLIAGDDADAKARLGDLVAKAGLRPLDAGPLERAHWLEGLGFVHMTIASGAGNFGTTVKIIG